jgi:hypothetical protein
MRGDLIREMTGEGTTAVGFSDIREIRFVAVALRRFFEKSESCEMRLVPHGASRGG